MRKARRDKSEADLNVLDATAAGISDDVDVGITMVMGCLWRLVGEKGRQQVDECSSELLQLGGGQHGVEERNPLCCVCACQDEGSPVTDEGEVGGPPKVWPVPLLRNA